MKRPASALFVAAGWCALALAQAAEQAAGAAPAEHVLQGGQITESALVEALTPAPSSVLTRSIRSGQLSPPRQAGAALLITFQTNSTSLTDEAKRELDVVGKALNTSKLSGFKFRIEGHADPRGSPKANLRLSQGRAEQVRQYLVIYRGVRPDRLSAIGKGDLEPMNTSYVAAPENRRVTFVNLLESNQ